MKLKNMLFDVNCQCSWDMALEIVSGSGHSRICMYMCSFHFGCLLGVTIDMYAIIDPEIVSFTYANYNNNKHANELWLLNGGGEDENEG